MGVGAGVGAGVGEGFPVDFFVDFFVDFLVGFLVGLLVSEAALMSETIGPALGGPQGTLFPTDVVLEPSAFTSNQLGTEEPETPISNM